MVMVKKNGQQTTSNTNSEESNENDTSTNHRYVVAFKDITEYRKLQSAEKAVEREAMMSKAMSDSMEVLTHELRTPLQGKNEQNMIDFPVPLVAFESWKRIAVNQTTD